MGRVRFIPGSKHSFTVRRSVGKKEPAQYVTARMSMPLKWSQALLATGRIRVNGEACAPGNLVDASSGTVFEIEIPPTWPEYMRPVEMPLDILYEDSHLLVLNKPAGIVVHPARGHLDNNTLQNGVLFRYQEDLKNPLATIGPPHRLDLDTSGAIIYSRTSEAYGGLVRQFTEKSVRKAYLALTDGRADFAEKTVELPLGKDPENGNRSAVMKIENGGKEARTHFFVEQAGEDWSLIRAQPETGRPHQIRVHLATLGLPIQGDKDYNPLDQNGQTANRPSRQMLHARELCFFHPCTGERLCLHAPLLEDMRAAIAKYAGSNELPA